MACPRQTWLNFRTAQSPGWYTRGASTLDHQQARRWAALRRTQIYLMTNESPISIKSQGGGSQTPRQRHEELSLDLGFKSASPAKKKKKKILLVNYTPWVLYDAGRLLCTPGRLTICPLQTHLVTSAPFGAPVSLFGCWSLCPCPFLHLEQQKWSAGGAELSWVFTESDQ